MSVNGCYSGRCGCCIPCIAKQLEREKQAKTCPISFTFTVQDRYGAPFDHLQPPDGYEFTGEFRPPKENEFVLGRHGSAIIGTSPLPGLILRPRPKRKRIIFEECFEISGAPLAAGTWFEADNRGDLRSFRSIIQLSPGDVKPCAGRVYSRREEEF